MNKISIIAHMKEELQNFSRNSNRIGYISNLNEQQCKDILYNINMVLMNLGNRVSAGKEINIKLEQDLKEGEHVFVLFDENEKEINRSNNLLNLLFLAEL